MSNQNDVRAGVSVNASSDWVVFTGKLPQQLKKKLKVVSAQTGRKQQEILAEALESYMSVKGI
ncbi:hypothetical protein VPZ60_004233 [Salmonella enterica]|nr:hypothetical protein [Salmonella enterica]